MSKIKIVAEIGCNHNGDFNIAKELIIKAHAAGADSVKFQSFIPKNLVSKFALKAEYQKENDGGGSQLEMLERLALSNEDYKKLKSFAESIGIEIFSTPFDTESLEFLNGIGQNIWKIPSGEITNLPLLEKIAETECEDKQIILSTGMSVKPEIEFAAGVLSKSKNTHFTVLHCNTQYPTLPEDMNLKAMLTLKNYVPKNWHIGLSDHSEGTVAAVAAVAIGAEFIEKHFTLDKNLPGPDHKASVTPIELEKLVSDVRKAEIMLGDGEKRVTDSEKANKFVARKSIVAKKNIKKGETFTEGNIACKRPGNGISPIHWYVIIGKKAEKDFSEDELISCKGVKREDE